MASVFKRKRKVKLASGKTVTRQSAKWHVKYTDADGIDRRVIAYKDKTASQQLAARLEKEAELGKEGVVSRYKEHQRKPLTEHLKDFKQSLLDKGNTEDHVRLTHNRVKAILSGCKFVFITDISASRVQRYLAELRGNGEGISAQTFNFYLQAVKQFCKWLVQDQRTGESPLEYLKGLNVRTDRRHDRRSLEPAELRRLLETTASAPKRFGMSGTERYLLYRFAAETGLRANEIRNLKVGDFDCDNLTVTAKAGYSKRRREDVQPLRPDTAALLQDFFMGKMPNVKAFGGTCKQLTKRTSDMIETDLTDAEIPYVDDAGRYADFHGLRHTTGSLLAASGVHPKVAQSIMRHSDINLTMSRYTHTLAGQEAKAVAGLPDLSLPSSGKQAATGTDDRCAAAVQDSPKRLTPKLTPQLTPTAYSECNQLAAFGKAEKMQSGVRTDRRCQHNGDSGMKRAHLSPDDSETGEAGIRTPGTGVYPYDGLANRCLKPLGHLSKSL